MSEQQRIVLSIKGMSCVSCARHVAEALRSVPSVLEVKVPTWQAAGAEVVARAEVADALLIAAVEKAGYGATVRHRQPLPTDGQASRPGDEHHFDLIVIGGGSGGFAATIAASELGKRAAMIQDGVLGGTCVNVGCVPSKTLIRAAHAWHSAGHHPFKGVHTAQVALDWPAVRAEKEALVATLRQSKYADVLAAYPDITLIEGRATFRPDGSVQVGRQTYKAGRYVIATGAQPRMFPFPGLQEAEPLNSTTLMGLERLPRSLIVLGGRAVALELGQMMARLGVEVLILQRSARLIPEHEPEIGRAIQSYLEDEGIGVITGVQVERLGREGDIRVVHARVQGQARTFRADQILMALGRQPNTAGLGLEDVGVQVDDQGAIVINEYMQTSNPIIYATGDVTTNPDYVYLAAAGGARAAWNALTEIQKPLDLSAVPGVIFTDPQIATVGLTEAAVRRHGYEVQTSTLSLEHVTRAQAARDTRGLIKLVADAQTRRLLGAHMLAAEAGEAIQTATLAVKFGFTLDDLTDTLFPYLTQVEGLKLAAQAFEKDVAKLSCCAG